jgi:hypothetical protein
MHFLAITLEDEEDNTFVINLILSSYITAMSNILMHVVEGSEAGEMLMRKFIKNLRDSIKAIDQINNVKTTRCT